MLGAHFLHEAESEVESELLFDSGPDLGLKVGFAPLSPRFLLRV